MGEGRSRTREMGGKGRDHLRIAGNIPDLRTGRLLHGVDQRRQPARIQTIWTGNLGPTNLKSRCLKLLSHRRRIFPERRQPGICPGVPANLPQRKCGACDLLHREPFRSVVLVGNGPRNAPDDVGPAARYRDRLRPDRNRRGGRLDCIGFPHSHLRNSVPIAASPLDGSTGPRKGSGCAEFHPTISLIGRPWPSFG